MQVSTYGAFALACLPVGLAAESLDDFTNNLLSDLAPILALLGERVTTQFMSQSLGWEDCIVLAMAPLGIITIIVSSIRVGGPALLKAIVGRARESQSIAEMEVMSSTSEEVCEMYNGQSIVRCQGKAPVWEFICLVPKGMNSKDPKASNGKPPDFEFMTLSEALRDSKLTQIKGHSTKPRRLEKERYVSSYLSMDQTSTNQTSTTESQESDTEEPVVRRAGLRSLVSTRPPPGILDVESAQEVQEESARSAGSARAATDPDEEAHTDGVVKKRKISIIHDTRPDAPNLCLNLQYDPDRRGVRIAAASGLLVQAGVLIFDAIMVLHPNAREKFRKDDALVPRSAFAMTFTGTIMLNLGLLLCAHVVESGTREEQYQAPDGADVDIHMYWIQQKQTVNDQFFDSYAIFPRRPSPIVTKSRRDIDSMSLTAKVCAAVLVAQAVLVDPNFFTWAGPAKEQAEQREERWQRAALAALKIKTLVGTVVTVTGFILQFIGLRSMNSYASLAQLGAVAIMSAWRAWLRRGFANDFHKMKLLPGFELDWLAWEMASQWHDLHHTGKQARDGEKHNHYTGRYHHLPGFWHPITGLGRAPQTSTQGSFTSSTYTTSSSYETSSGDGASAVEAGETLATGISVQISDDGPSVRSSETPSSRSAEVPQSTAAATHHAAQCIFETRRELARLTNFHGDSAQDAANLAQAIEKTMDQFFPISRQSDSDIERLSHWPINVAMGGKTSGSWSGHVTINLDAAHGRWEARADDFSALMSLWMYSISGRRSDDTTERDAMRRDAWLRKTVPPNGVRLFGPVEEAQRDQLRQDLIWWMPRRDLHLLHMRASESSTSRQPEVGLSLAGTREDLKHRARVHSSLIVGCLPTEYEKLAPGLTRRNTVVCEPTDWDAVFDKDWPKCILAMESAGSLVNLYAKDILFTFLRWAAQELTSPLKGHTETREAADNTFTFICTRELNDLVEVFHSLDLGSEGELHLSLISALSLAAKLPVPQAMFHATRKKAAAACHRGDWDEELTLYRQLFLSVRPYRETDIRIHAFGAALCKAYEETSGIDIDWHERRLNPYGYVGRGGRKPLLQVTEDFRDLRDHNRDVMNSLEDLYKRQRLPSNADDLPQYPDYFNITELHRSCAIGSQRRVKAALRQQSISILNEQDIYGWTPLHYAVARSYSACARLLINRGADLQMADLGGYTALHYSSNFLEGRALAQAAGPEMSLVGKATWSRSVRTVLPMRANDGKTPLHRAAEEGNVPVLLSLCEASGGEIDFASLMRCEDHAGFTPIHTAAGHGRAGTLEYLYSRGGDIVRPARGGRTVLHLAVTHGESKGRLETVATLIKLSMVDLEYKDSGGETALLLACRMKRWDVIESLIEAKASLHTRDHEERTPLYWVVKSGDASLLARFLKMGANINETDSGGHTLLHYAVWGRAVDVVRMLSQHGADFSIKDSKGVTPLDGALWMGDLSSVLLMLYKGVVCEPRPSLKELKSHPAIRSRMRTLKIRRRRASKSDSLEG